jgi:class 3 adenylate cyclase
MQIEVIREFGGQVDKLMGDGLMAFWFIDTEDRRKLAPKAALDCARLAVEKVRAFLTSQNLEHDLDIRIGLHCGPVAFGDFGAKNRIAVTLLGDTVNAAARYEQARNEGLGRIRLSPELRDSIVASGSGGNFAFSGPHKLAVKQTEILVFSI